jgi:hypothetical protein
MRARLAPSISKVPKERFEALRCSFGAVGILGLSFRALGMQPPCAFPNLEGMLLGPLFEHFARPMNRVA